MITLLRSQGGWNEASLQTRRPQQTQHAACWLPLCFCRGAKHRHAVPLQGLFQELLFKERSAKGTAKCYGQAELKSLGEISRELCWEGASHLQHDIAVAQLSSYSLSSLALAAFFKLNHSIALETLLRFAGIKSWDAGPKIFSRAVGHFICQATSVPLNALQHAPSHLPDPARLIASSHDAPLRLKICR